ncbi:hypothetical protein YT1_p10103 (plasmid) [Rhodococcus ruber]|nr:hypothetical protein YT1_p10103 [Rhodococcus ruber]
MASRHSGWRICHGCGGEMMPPVPTVRLMGRAGSPVASGVEALTGSMMSQPGAASAECARTTRHARPARLPRPLRRGLLEVFATPMPWTDGTEPTGRELRGTQCRSRLAPQGEARLLVAGDAVGPPDPPVGHELPPHPTGSTT